MAEELYRTSTSGLQEDKTVDIQHRLPAPNYIEETSAEIAAPVSFTGNTLSRRDTDLNNRDKTATEGKGVGFAALALSIISLFVLPILFGAAGIILGFVARRRGANSLGNWAIGIGAISIIVGMFILPFF
ncbi:DUF4190 domain-containing protein [Bacillus sp. T3]|uniref:DUF4190 domain-containing protein n=1 Tax=Bacillus sp. T3 TaxID=467262 RepID=UPI002981E298|nr:DUF4190 domain-containing protein [Bacillus sp. T3]